MLRVESPKTSYVVNLVIKQCHMSTQNWLPLRVVFSFQSFHCSSWFCAPHRPPWDWNRNPAPGQLCVRHRAAAESIHAARHRGRDKPHGSRQTQRYLRPGSAAVLFCSSKLKKKRKRLQWFEKITSRPNYFALMFDLHCDCQHAGFFLQMPMQIQFENPKFEC